MFSYFENRSAAVLSKGMAKTYDSFILECLKSFGITRENVQEYRNRVFVERMPVIFSEECSIEKDHYFIDNAYCFTVEKKISFGDDSYKTEFRMVVDEHRD